MRCWNCDAPLKAPPHGKYPFRAECDVCNAALHCCRNCVYYKPGLPNDCAVPGTDFIADRTKMNFCEDFRILGQHLPKGKDPSQIEKRLFGDDNPPTTHPKNRFDSLFKD